jgi:hypothetical protein
MIFLKHLLHYFVLILYIYLSDNNLELYKNSFFIYDEIKVKFTFNIIYILYMIPGDSAILDSLSSTI